MQVDEYQMEAWHSQNYYLISNTGKKNMKTQNSKIPTKQLHVHKSKVVLHCVETARNTFANL